MRTQMVGAVVSVVCTALLVLHAAAAARRRARMAFVGDLLQGPGVGGKVDRVWL